MNKDEFIKLLSNIEKTDASKIYEKYIIAEKTGRTVYTGELYPPNVWTKLEHLNSKIGIKVFNFGMFDDAERRIIAFSNDEPENYPLRLLEIKNKSKFSVLSHRDYLGALMSLGIKREKMGDLVVEENKCYMVANDDIYNYIIDNLELIGRCPCTIREVTEVDEIPKPAMEDRTVVATSYRLDCVVGAICGLSRSKAVELISGGKTLVNYSEINEKDRMVHEGDVLTIRGYGKFRLSDTIGNSGSGRLKLLIKKYI